MNSDNPDGAPVPVGRQATDRATPVRAGVVIGFGSPADDSGVTQLDLNDVLIRHPQATFLMRAAGDAMREAGIDDGDLLLIDRAIAPAYGQVVIAVVDNEFVCRHLVRQGASLLLRATGSEAADIVPGDGQELHVWGVVTTTIKSMAL